MPQFHTLKVKEIRRETEECVSLQFDVPETLDTDYRYIQGQYLTLKTEIDGEEVRRYYSICSCPLDNELRVAVKAVPMGKFSTYANEVLQEGDSLEVMTPIGKFYTELKEEQAKHYVAFVAGSGITPVMSIMKTVLRKEPNSHFTLFYGNKNFDSIIFRDEIEALKNDYLERLSVYHLLSRELTDAPLFNGRLNGEKAAQFCDRLFNWSSIDEFFLCGPGEMIMDIKDTLIEKGVDKKKVHFELFTTPGQAKAAHKPMVEKAPEAYDAQVQVTLDGMTYAFGLDEDGPNILDAALHHGADVPFACKGAVCCTCKAKVMEGKVEMDLNYALEEDELEAGYVLTCQAHPRSEKVLVSFDD